MTKGRVGRGPVVVGLGVAQDQAVEAAGVAAASIWASAPPWSWPTTETFSSSRASSSPSTMVSWAGRDQSAPGGASVSPRPRRSGATQRWAELRAGMTLRHTNEENGQPCRSRTGGPDPSPTYATRASPTSAKRFEAEKVSVSISSARGGGRAPGPR